VQGIEVFYLFKNNFRIENLKDLRKREREGETYVDSTDAKRELYRWTCLGLSGLS